ncbi:hypothetical protein JKP88DRAFT_289249 [Tribonema minus]|uniref:Uncharacterized protein n=1 Tax=Tribonema minus TaxID=303371 RepID=A0A835Z3E4_9STRA|nr:hypothetical protein JKP88DRAFT_289249 [Tribonema minus]
MELLNPSIVSQVLDYAGPQQFLFHGGVSKLWRRASAAHDRITAHAEAAKHLNRLQWAWASHRTLPLCRAMGRWAHEDAVRLLIRDVRRVRGGVDALIAGAVAGDRVGVLQTLEEAAQGSDTVAAWAEPWAPRDHAWNHAQSALDAIDRSHLRLAVAAAVLAGDVAVRRAVAATVPSLSAAAAAHAGAVANVAFCLDDPETCLFAHATWPEVFTADAVAAIAARNTSVAIARDPRFCGAVVRHLQFDFNSAIWLAAKDLVHLDWFLGQPVPVADWDAGAMEDIAESDARYAAAAAGVVVRHHPHLLNALNGVLEGA